MDIIFSVSISVLMKWWYTYNEYILKKEKKSTQCGDFVPEAVCCGLEFLEVWWFMEIIGEIILNLEFHGNLVYMVSACKEGILPF